MYPRSNVQIPCIQQIYHSKEAGTKITNLNSDISGFCNNSFTQGLNKNSAVKKAKSNFTVTKATVPECPDLNKYFSVILCLIFLMGKMTF